MSPDSCVRNHALETSALNGEVGSGHPQTQMEIPVVDLGGRREEVLEKVKRAATTVGFFQVVNHGVPEILMEEMLNMSREFHAMPEEEKIKYTKHPPSRVSYTKSPFGQQFNHFFCYMPSESVEPELTFAGIGGMVKYAEHMKQLGTLLLEILCEALGIKTDNRLGMDCTKGHTVVLNYYPKSAEPTIGINKHADRGFLAILAQDQVGGLQVLQQNQWLNVPPVSGALIVNIGDLLKLVSNDALVSSEHRAWTNSSKARVSVACFFMGDVESSKIHEPVKELLSETSPPLYRGTTLKDYLHNCSRNGYGGSSNLMHLKL